MSVLVRFIQSGSFNSGEFKSLDLDRISNFQISRQRNTCDLLATTPENLQPNTPYVIARRSHEYELKDILTEIQKLRNEKKDVIYEITDTEAHRVTK
jgi:hypothetical protein